MSASDALEFALPGLSDAVAAVEAELDRALSFGSDGPERLVAAMRYMGLAPGKRLRPLLVVWSCEALGGDLQRALPAAAAVELIHAYSLIHDDLPCMDDDVLRRGLPTCHVAFDEATAVLAGDALQARAFEWIARRMHPESAALECLRILGSAAGAERLVGGQADDLAAEADDFPAERRSVAWLERIHLRKTGALFRASLQMGAVAAEAGEIDLARLDAFGRALGLAFQVKDDLLDCESSPEDLGKKTQKDAGRGKLTYPALLGVEASRERLVELHREADEALRPLGPAADSLRTLMRFVVERKR